MNRIFTLTLILVLLVAFFGVATTIAGVVPDPIDVTAITGQRIAGPVTSWLTQDGPYTVEHLAGQSLSGDLLVFFWSPRANWQIVNVSAITGQRIAGPVTSWLTQDGPYTVEHLAGQSLSGDLLVFFWSPQANWQVVNVSAITGQQIAGPVTSWLTRDGPNLVEHLAGVGPDEKLYTFWWTPATDWRVVNITQIAGGGEMTNSAPTVYQLADGNENVEILGTHSQSGSLFLYWWKPSRDWQQVNLSEITGHEISTTPQGWLTRDGANVVEHFAVPDPDGHLLVFYNYSQPRHLTDQLGEPFQSLQRVRTHRNVLTILWDPHSPMVQALPRATIEATLFGATNSVQDYFLENSNRYFTIENAGVLGWYDADKPMAHYWNESCANDPNDTDGDGWLNGHVEKWAEAIRKATADFNFAAYDSNGDGVLSPSELGILIIIPSDGLFGTNRPVVGREFPTQDCAHIPTEPLVVDGVRIDVIAEVYIGNPANLGVAAHELSHLLLGHDDMYFNFFNSAAAGDYSLMDRTYKTTHLDPFAKLKLGWVRPKIIFRGDLYSLHNVEEGHDVWVLFDPTRSTDEYFIVENRWGGQSYDQQMADNGGLAVWHIMENPAVYGTVAPPPFVNPADWAMVSPGAWGRRAIRMIRPVLTPPFDDSRALWDGAQPGVDYDLLSSDPDPNHAVLRWADGSPSGFSLRAISAAGAQMEATIEVPDTP
jgi:M6 family metalloprotease-like protein